MTTGTKVLTYEEYLNEPETKLRFDIVDGVVIMSAGPTLSHQTIAGNIYYSVWGFVHEQGLGEVWFAPLDIVVQRDPLRVRQPDVMYVSAENFGILGDRVNGAPDWVAEILSPGNRRADLQGKLADYARIGVRECWLVAPRERTVEALVLERGAWRRLYLRGICERAESAALPGFSLPVTDIFRGV